MEKIIENTVLGIIIFIFILLFAMAPSICCGLERIGHIFILWLEKKMAVKTTN